MIFFSYTRLCARIDSVLSCPLSVVKVNWPVWSILVSVCAQPRSSSMATAAEEKHSGVNERKREQNEGKERGRKREKQDEQEAGAAGL